MARGPLTFSTSFQPVADALLNALSAEGFERDTALSELRGLMRGWELETGRVKNAPATADWPTPAKMLWAAMWDAVTTDEDTTDEDEEEDEE